MKDGFIKTAVVSPKLKVADIEYNKTQIISIIENATKKGVKILALPELCITGATCGDLFFQDILIENARIAVFEIAKATKELDILVVLGCPVSNIGKLYNCAIAINNGEIIGIVPKTHLKNHGEVNESRYFSTFNSSDDIIYLDHWDSYIDKTTVFSCGSLQELAVGIEVGDDLFSVFPPSNILATSGANVIVNISANNEIIGRESYRKNIIKSQSSRLTCAYLYANAGEGESTQDLIFSGHSLIAENSVILAEKKPFKDEILITEIDINRINNERRKNSFFTLNNNDLFRTFTLEISETNLSHHISKTPFVPENKAEKLERCEQILEMQSRGLMKRIVHTGVHKLVLGLSGGSDSTLAVLVCIKAMDLLKRSRKDIFAVSMPCFGTTSRTRNNAEKLAQELGIYFKEIDITKSVTQHFKDIGLDENDRSVTYENAQARERTQVLMDISNQVNGMVIGTGDLSELALGWATYNGDHMSMYAVNSSVPKTLVSNIIDYYAKTCDNEALKSVLLDIIDTPVSPELLPSVNDEVTQITEDVVGPYILHDFFLYYVVRCGFSPKKIFRMACYTFENQFDKKTILKWMKKFYWRFFSQQFKRSCLPDGVKVGSVSLSPRGDWQMPSDACVSLWQKEIDEILL